MSKLRPFFLTAVLCIAFSSFVYAGIAVDPTVTEITVAQGTPYEGTYTVTNTSDETLEITVETVNWLEKYLQKENTADIAKWLTIAEPHFTLAPKEVKKVPYRITIDHSIQDEQVAQVYFGFSSADPEVTMFRTRLGVILYVGVEGKEQPKSEMKSMVIAPVRNADGTVTVHAKITIENVGNVHSRPFGLMRIIKGSEVVVHKELRPSKGIYAGTTEAVEDSIPNIDLKPGTYKCEVELECGMYETSTTLKAQEFFTVN